MQQIALRTRLVGQVVARQVDVLLEVVDAAAQATARARELASRTAVQCYNHATHMNFSRSQKIVCAITKTNKHAKLTPMTASS
jgi:hypothetical protein